LAVVYTSTQAGNLVKSVDSLHFINGVYVSSHSGKVKENINSATEEVISYISQGGQEEVDAAVAAANEH
jgi:aminomuconate-semialdehyde/2-hydroxymuconate-6-semialdehyde dehydrogenase